MKQVAVSRISLKSVMSGIVYHYTSHKNFKKIIKSGEFLLSNYPDLRGDPNELIWAFDTYESITKPLFSGLNLKGMRPDEFYVLSTCLRENNRCLWEQYAVDFTGVVIGIQADALYETYYHKSNQIHMTPMDYNPDGFVELCKKSVEGRSPIPFLAPINLPDMREYSYEQRKKTILDAMPGYREWEDSPENKGAAGAVALQKETQYSPEEEVRILHSQDGALNNPLEIRRLDGRRRAVLPLIIGRQHFIKEVVIAPDCAMTPGEIKRLLRAHEIQTDVRIIEWSEIL